MLVREGRKSGLARAATASEEVWGAVWEGMGWSLPGSSGREENGGEAAGLGDDMADSEGMVVMGIVCGRGEVWANW